MIRDEKERPVRLGGQTGRGDDKRGACDSDYSISDNIGGDLSGATLGNTTVKVSTLDKRYTKWQLLNKVQSMFEGSNYRVLDCQKAIGQVQVLKGADGAYFGGVMACGSVWLCPVCSRRIAFERSEMIRKATESGYNLILLTVTLQHTRVDPLADVLEGLKLALRKLKQGRWWKNFRDRWGLEAYVSSYEITYGHDNGWHPHAHILIFTDGKIDVDTFWSELASRYVWVAEKIGRYASKYHALDARHAQGSEASSYLTKWSNSDVAWELTGSANKRGSLSFWDLVIQEKISLVLEYARATRGLKSLTWSHGAKEKLGVSDDPEADSGQVDIPELVADVPGPVWQVIRSQSLQGYVLELAVTDADDLKRYLASLEGGKNTE